MNEHKLNKESSRGDQAKLILDNELVIEARKIITDNLHDKWETTSVKQAEDREYIYLQLKACKEFFRHIENTLMTGKMAKKTIAERFKFK